MRILAALDDSHYSEAVVQAIMSQFPRGDNEVHLLNVIEPLPAMYGGAEWGYVMDWKAVTEDQQKQAAAIIERAAKPLRDKGFHVTSTVVEGIPKKVILEYAAEWPADLIMMGSHGRNAMERFFLGSVSEGVARHAPCSVQIVRRPMARAVARKVMSPAADYAPQHL